MRKAKRKQKKNEKAETPTKFTVNQQGSLMFRCTGAKVIKATLEVNGVILSLLQPTYGPNWKSEDLIDLPFFGPGKALHRALISDMPVFVTLVHEAEGNQTRYPSLSIGAWDNSLTWEKVNDGKYEENVSAGSATGPRELTLAYYKSESGGICGYIAEVKQ